MAVHVITGDDESLVLTAVTDLVHRLVGSGDRSLMVDDFDGDDYVLAQVTDAAQTPPFLSDRRVVIARGVGRFGADEVDDLARYLADPLETTDLVLVQGSGRLPKLLGDALKAAKAVMVASAAPTRQRERSDWYGEQIGQAGLRLDGAAANLLSSWLGEDAGRLAGILDTLVSAYGTTRKLTVDDVRPFLGEAGGVPPWDLTDAIDRGDTHSALDVLHRMMGAGDRHPLQIMAILHAHYVKLLSLDGSGAHDEASAAAAMGIKPGFPAKKALDQFRRLGATSVGRAVELLAGADVDLRGAKDWPDDLVMDVLVARLSKLAPAARTRSG